MQQLKPLKPGDAPADGPLSAACWNRVVSAVSSLEAIRRSGRCAPGGIQFPDPCIVRAKNSSGTDRGRFEVLGVDGSVFTPTSNLTQFQNAIYLDGKKPTADHLGKFVVLCQPLRAGAIGWAWAAGVCVVKVDFDYEDQPYADVKADDAGLLKGGEGGAAQVLWKEEGTGTKWAVVRLGVQNYPILYGTLAADTTSSPTNVTVGSKTISAKLRMLPASGKKYAKDTGVYLGHTPDGWEIISVLACTVDA